MINIIAIYVRQSVDKIDSISIETQIDFCKVRILPNEDYEIFSDKGYSGGTQNRPQYQKMLALCRQGEVEKIVTYKLDRISRSLLHFVLLLEELEKTNTELVSCTESFSSRSEMGVMIMKMLMMFAEMERKNIRNRVRDNYYARGEKGFYLGGTTPFGYKKIPIKIHDKSTSGYEIIPFESEIITEIYNLYVFKNYSINQICKYLNGKKIYTRKGKAWTPNSLLRLVRNPFYVCADHRIYSFFAKENAHLTTPSENFVGKYGCVCYGEKKNRTGAKFSSFSEEHITLGNHRGIIPSHIWLLATEKSRQKRYVSSTKVSTKTFLCGLIKCGECGGNFTTTSAKGYIYFYCRKKKSGSCGTKISSVRGDFLEKIFSEIIKKVLISLSKEKRKTKISKDELSLRGEIATQKAKLSKVQEKIDVCCENELDELLNICQKLSQDIAQKQIILEKIVEKSCEMCYTDIAKLGENFQKLPFEIKKRISQEVAEKIIISETDIKKIKIYLKTGANL